MPRSFALGRDTRVNLLLGSGHFLSHFYQLCLPPLFIAWQKAFEVSFAELGLIIAMMSATAGLLQTPMGFLVDRYGARRFLIGGTLLMTLSEPCGPTAAFPRGYLLVSTSAFSIVGCALHVPHSGALSQTVAKSWLE